MQSTPTTESKYIPYTVVPWKEMNSQWLCSCTTGPDNNNDEVLECSHCNATWGHIDCYELDDKSPSELQIYYHICYNCRKDNIIDGPTNKHNNPNKFYAIQLTVLVFFVMHWVIYNYF